MKGWDRIIAAQPLIISSAKKIYATSPKNTSPKDILRSPLSSLATNKIIDIDKLNQELEAKLTWSDIFDSMMESCLNSPQHVAFESHMVLFFHSNRAIFWEKRPNSSAFLSRTLKSEISASCSLIQQIINSSQPVIPNLLYDPDIITSFSLQSFDHQFFVPLRYPDGSICAIIQLSRHQNCSPFGQEEFKIAEFVMKKFILYGSPFFEKERIVGLASKVSQVGLLSQTTNHIKKTLETAFQCNSPDIWFLQMNDGSYFRYDNQIREFIGVYKCSTGVIGLALRNENANHCITINSNKVGELKHYSSSIDGDANNPILMSSCEFEGRIWCVCLRGERSNGSYTKDDQSRFSTIIPFIARSLSYSGGFLRRNLNSAKKSENSKIDMINFTSSIVDSHRNIYEVINLVQEKVTDLLKAEICRVLIVDSKSKELRSDFENGIILCKKSPLDSGIAGSTVTSRLPIICSKPEDDPKFDREVDAGGKTTKIQSLLSVPVIFKNDVKAVIMALNKSGGEFNESDKIKLTTISTFFGIAMKNGEICQASYQIISQLKKIVNHSNDTIENVLTKIKEIIHASTVTLFVVQQSDSSLHEFATIGEKLNSTIQFATFSINSKKSSFFSIGQDSDKSIVISCVPFFDDDDRILGVVEFSCDFSEFNEELNLIESFVSIASSSSLSKSCLKEFSDYEEEKSKLREIVGIESIEISDTPKSLLFLNELFEPSFIVQGNSEIDLIKIVFSCFDHFKLKQEFKLTNQKLFSFVSNLSKSCDNDENSYHNWSHSVSTLLFGSILLMKSKMNETFTKLEILSFLIASLGHNLSQDEIQNENDEIPFSILYKSQNVMGMNHCAQLAKIMSKESCNLLSALDQNALNSAWELIFYLIFSSHMSVHFDVLKENEKCQKDNSFSLKNSEHRNLQLALLLKCADFSECLKDFEYADKFSKIICEEFFNFGPIENIDGIEYLNENHKRKFLDREKSFLGFVTFVALPLFESVYEYNNDLMFIKDCFTANLEKWSESNSKNNDSDQNVTEETNEQDNKQSND